jgi:sugar-phosphatase
VTDQQFGLSGRDFGAVLFDMDGTLVDSIGSVERSWVRFSQEYGVDPALLLGFHGVPARGVLEALLPEVDQEVAFARIETIEVEDVEGVEALPGAVGSLETLAAQGIPTAIVTSASRPLFAARVGASGLRAPNAVVTADDVERGKPAPDPYLAAAEALGVDPADCLVVEDAVSGIRSGLAAGCATLAVGSTTPREELATVADAVVADLSEVTFFAEAGRVRVSPR